MNRDDKGRVGPGEIPLFKGGKGGAQIFSATDMNRLVKALNALLKLTVTRGATDNFTVSDANATLQIQQDAASSGGVGPGVTLMTLVSYHQDATNGDYLVCRPDGGKSDGSNDVFVAVEPQLQSDLTGRTNPDGNHWSFGSYNQAGQSRVATGSTTLNEYITPPFEVGDTIPVCQCNNAYVMVGTVLVVLIAITGRQWAAVPPP
jgi:hypothetical protein